MRYFEAPDRYEGAHPNRPWLSRKAGEEVLFLGGGITGCPDWQKKIINRLANIEDLAVLNPRRANFPIDDPKAAAGQIVWEWEHLRVSSIVMFWFPQETLCPITLYELGCWTQKYHAERDFELIIGCHSEYSRRLDVEIQTHLVLPKHPIHGSLDSMVKQIKTYF